MSYSYTKFRPQVNVSVSEDDGTISYQVDWSDCCDGDFDEDGDGIGYDYSDNAWDQLMNLMQRVPQLLGYPTAYVGGNIVLTDPAQQGGPAWNLAAPQAGPVVQYETCQHYSPSAERIEMEGAIPLEKWPFGKHFPYGVCTNPQVVGQGGFGPCRYDHKLKMRSCAVYMAEPLVRRGQVKVGNITFTLESGRGGQGLPMWRLINRADHQEEDNVQTWVGNDAETTAREQWAQLTGGAEVEPIQKQTRTFIKSLVGACQGAGE